ncbi:MAG TPA: hypothetical protein VJA65_09255 [bacterium]|nr:hypothetical protein [bacterium]
MRVLSLILTAVVAVALLTLPVLTTAPTADAAMANSVIAGFLNRMGVTWKNTSDPNEFLITKRTGLKSADVIEVYIYNDAKNEEIRLRAFAIVNGRYLALSRSSNQTALMKAMLQKNERAFGAYFLDDDGDIGFKYVFTTEASVGYVPFQVVVNELLRISDEAVVPLYNQYR